MSAFKVAVTRLTMLLVRIPMVLKTIILHSLRMSPGSGKQDLRTELLTVVIRSLFTADKPMLKTQQISLRDPGIQGPMWVSKVTLPQPEFDVRDAVLSAIEALGNGHETFNLPGVMAVEAEWTGYRKGVGKKEPQLDISEEEKYHMLQKEISSDKTILYFHGGAYFMMDPCTHRVLVAHISRLTGAPVLSVRYRLAPQNPFPAALVDALTAYLSLIHPPKGSLHKPVPANKIVIAGDSAGGNLSLVLLQTLLTLRRISRTVLFHGEKVEIELPAGVACMSPWCDVTLSMPSVVRNRIWDYMDIRPGKVDEPDYSIPFPVVPFPADEVWPASPPRVDIFCNATAVSHPLVSPVAASSDLWKDAPPVFISVGEESLTDEGLIVARRIYKAGVPVRAQMFEGMPHCHGMIMMSTLASKKFFEGFTAFCSEPQADQAIPNGVLRHYGLNLQNQREIPLEKAVDVSEEEVEDRISRHKAWRIETENAMLKEWQERARL
ncbi:hypothetical protein N7493_004604 [Penicillium malachiteum]|uniref:Alpha/beta hydrolase fold-3 domain-containing protein n=1 Tax=Penicillium malachiteum TaxID=1324776 RepID=A0AAD6HNV0_9EURO|nr:hypothetical protein N7493_004604 [Penicillium malachiteum]